MEENKSGATPLKTPPTWPPSKRVPFPTRQQPSKMHMPPRQDFATMNRQPPPGLKKPKPDDAVITPAISRAMFHMKAATPRADADPTRPIYHFRPPAQWTGNPTGAICWDGWCHLFYQFNPYGDSVNSIHWGHVRSRDLVQWEHMPIALYPSEDRGEEHCGSGCAAIAADNKPMIFYTCVRRGKVQTDYTEQWAALGESQLMVWRKYAGNPLLHPESNGGLAIKDWRDPFVFRDSDRTFMLTGGKLDEKDGGEACVFIYESDNKELTRWTYRGILFKHARKEVAGIEAPNFFQIGDKHVLLLSPHGLVEYYVGKFDVNTLTFTPETRGVVDGSENYYATTILRDDANRCVLFGSVRGFRPNRGWNGCIGLPRVLSLGADNLLRQEPLPELRKLRSNYVKVQPFMLSRCSQILQDVKGDTLEITVEITPDDVRAFGLRVRRSAEGISSIAIRFHDDVLDVAGVGVPLSLKDNAGKLALHVFLDKSVMAVFANGHVSCTRVIYPATGDIGVEVFAEGGEMTVNSIDAWTMRRPM
jgi:beta-fructofuranosidase